VNCDGDYSRVRRLYFRSVGYQHNSVSRARARVSRWGIRSGIRVKLYISSPVTWCSTPGANPGKLASCNHPLDGAFAGAATSR
jgi:hypothetical protein